MDTLCRKLFKEALTYFHLRVDIKERRAASEVDVAYTFQDSEGMGSEREGERERLEGFKPQMAAHWSTVEDRHGRCCMTEANALALSMEIP